MNVNIDARTLDMCLKTIKNIGNMTYQDICTGRAATVPWGTFDWLIFSLFLVPAVVLILIALQSVFALLRVQE